MYIYTNFAYNFPGKQGSLELIYSLLKEKGSLRGEGWKELVFSGTHITHSPGCPKRLSELEHIPDIFLGISSASDNLSEQHSSRVCLVTTLGMDFVQVRSPGG